MYGGYVPLMWLVKKIVKRICANFFAFGAAVSVASPHEISNTYNFVKMTRSYSKTSIFYYMHNVTLFL